MAVVADTLPLDRKSRPTNLPVQLTTFIGRDREIADALRLLSAARLLTLVGAGGVGKTRLALRVAETLQENYPDGVWLVDLSSITDPLLVPYAVAATIGSPEVPGEHVTNSLARYLQSRRLLIVVDNCEHVVAVCAELCDHLLRACPHLRILATSRQPIGVVGEITWRVPSLTVPDPNVALSTDEIGTSDAVRLFCDRAQLVRPQFVLGDDNAATVARVCRSLDGIPLAIELAAARVSVLSVEQIAERLHDRFRLLVATGRGVPVRQQTLRSVVEWSYDLTAPNERVLFRRLAVFAGGWTLKAAEAICPDDTLERNSVLDVLARLVEQSLVLADEEQQGERRYGLLDTLRAYAGEKLTEAAELSNFEARHRNWYAALGREAEREVGGPRQAAWFAQLAAEYDNLRAALSSCQDTDLDSGMQLAADLTWFWMLLGRVGEGREWLDGLLARAPSEPTRPARAAALCAAGYLASWLDDHMAARDLLEQSVAAWRILDDPLGLGLSVCSSAVAAYRRGDPPGKLMEECLQRWRGLGAPAMPCYMTLSDLAEMLPSEAGDARAVGLHEESLEQARQRGDLHGVACALRGLGHLAWLRGDARRAADLHRQSLELTWRLGDRLCTTRCLEELALAASAAGQPTRAATLFGAAEAWRDSIGVRLFPSEGAEHELGVESTRAALSTEAYARLSTQGRGLTPDQAVEFGLAAATPEQSAVSEPSLALDPLTIREREVVVLLGQGLSNRQVAETLVVSERTAEAHVTHILTKLGLHSRAQIAVWAAQHGLLGASETTHSP